jgi:DNA-binding LytR/AlgR family response regulator
MSDYINTCMTNNDSNTLLKIQVFDNQPYSTIKLMVKTKNGLIFVSKREISHFVACKHHVYLYTTTSQLKTVKNSKYFENILPNSFIRINHNHIINILQVQYITKSQIVKMNDGTEIAVSRRKWKEFNMYLQQLDKDPRIYLE